jgi:hemoglobin
MHRRTSQSHAIGPDERDQWLVCMDAALEKAGACEKVQSMLKPAMFCVANAVRNLEHCNRQPRGDGIIAIG